MRNYFEIISEKYNENSKLVDFEKMKSEKFLNLNIQEIKLFLYENGFRPDVIAYFLVMLSMELSSAQ